MVGSLVDAQIAELLAAERAARQHAFHGLLDDALGITPIEDEFCRAFLDAADETAVMVIDLLVALAAGEHHLLRIDHDDIVAVIDMRRERGLVLAAQPERDDRGEATDDETRRIDHHPLLLDIRRLGRSCFAEHGGFRVNADGAGEIRRARRERLHRQAGAPRQSKSRATHMASRPTKYRGLSGRWYHNTAGAPRILRAVKRNVNDREAGAMNQFRGRPHSSILRASGRSPWSAPPQGIATVLSMLKYLQRRYRFVIRAAGEWDALALVPSRSTWSTFR